MSRTEQALQKESEKRGLIERELKHSKKKILYNCLLVTASGEMQPRGLVVRRYAYGSRGPEFESRGPEFESHLTQNKHHG